MRRSVLLAADSYWSDTEQLDERTCNYTGLTADDALRADERLLDPAGRDDIKILRAPPARPSSGGSQSKRNPRGPAVCTHLRGQFFIDTFGFGAEPTIHTVHPASTVEREPGKGFRPRARTYALDFSTFWGQIDYLLAQNLTWPARPADPTASATCTVERQ